MWSWKLRTGRDQSWSPPNLSHWAGHRAQGRASCSSDIFLLGILLSAYVLIQVPRAPSWITPPPLPTPHTSVRRLAPGRCYTAVQQMTVTCAQQSEMGLKSSHQRKLEAELQMLLGFAAFTISQWLEAGGPWLEDSPSGIGHLSLRQLTFTSCRPPLFVNLSYCRRCDLELLGSSQPLLFLASLFLQEWVTAWLGPRRLLLLPKEPHAQLELALLSWRPPKESQTRLTWSSDPGRSYPHPLWTAPLWVGHTPCPIVRLGLISCFGCEMWAEWQCASFQEKI